MDNKQAIGRLDDIKLVYSDKVVLDYIHTLDEEDIQALNKAIKSLECIDEIIELIKDSSDKQYRNNGHWIYIGDKKDLADVLDIINKHLGE